MGQRVCESDGVTVARASNVALATVMLAGLIAACGSSGSFSIAEESMPTTSVTSVSENSLTTPPVPLPDTSERSDIDTSQRVAERSPAVTTTTVSVPPAPVARKDALYLSRFGVGSQRFGNDMSDVISCLLYTSPSPRDATLSRMPSSA